MGLARLVTRRKGTSSIVPVVVLGAAVSLGVVAVTASRFGWRRTKADKAVETAQPAPAAPEDDGLPSAAPRLKPAPAREPGSPRWDTLPAALAQAKPDPPSP
jgi:hypothetical protein